MERLIGEDYAFLVGTLIDQSTLARAAEIADAWRTPVHEVLIALGWIAEEAYVDAAARLLRAHRACTVTLIAEDWPASRGLLKVVNASGAKKLAVSPVALPPRALSALVAEQHARGVEVVFATAAELEAIGSGSHRRALLMNALHGLRSRDPELSATTPSPFWLKALLLAVAASTSAAFVLDWSYALTVAMVVVSFPFILITVLRVLAIRELFRGRISNYSEASRLPDDKLPIYSVLVPLYDEADVLGQLVQSLSSLDYPVDRLEVLLLLEQDDAKTIQAAAQLGLPAHFRVVVVPRGQPRTKPRALNYALGLVRGSFVVVYDAEDQPEPGQLREALARFRADGPALACVQARLNVYNSGRSFFTRQFTLEYSALFDGILPALERWRLPVPLGGTSNHFPVALLRQAGGWDPYNVTEDADLGIRLARFGYRTATITSTTWEEAPVRFRNWFGQRTRWLKGWLRTYLVHMRSPFRSLRELGLRGFLGLQLVMGAIFFAVLAHPLAYVLIAAGYSAGHFSFEPQTPLQHTAWWGSIITGVVGYASAIGVGAIAVAKRGRAGLVASAILMPVYWLLISLAGYRAIFQLIQEPYLWEKTRHGPNQE